MKRDPVPAVPADDPSAPGEFKFFVTSGSTESAGMQFVCPCGCGHQCWVQFEPGPPPAWKWNGNREKPTLTPSVYNTGLPCRWHGWLTDGVWRSV